MLSRTQLNQGRKGSRMDASDLEQLIGTFFTTDGTDIWEIEGCFRTPSCTLKNLKTDVKKTFGMNGLTARDFHRIKMPIIP